MSQTITVRRGNEYLTVSADDQDRYVTKGYDVLDDKGNVIVESVPVDVSSLRAAFNRHKAQIKELEAEVSSLKKQLEEAKLVKTKAEEIKPVEVETEIISEPIKTTGRKSKKS